MSILVPPDTIRSGAGKTMPAADRTVKVRSVWADNVEFEIRLIGKLIHEYPVVSMDTEFPGIVYRDPPDGRHRQDTVNYKLLKANVDQLKLIQVGLTLSNAQGNLPHLGTDEYHFIWEFNFRDFDVHRDSGAPDSVELLRCQGIDFELNREFGVDSLGFAELMMSSGLVCNDSVTWVTFHCAYDFGYLVKILTQMQLPEDLSGFLKLVKVFFGSSVFDVKHIMQFCGLFGGLDRVCDTLAVKRVIGKSHQAGSDSLATLQAFLKIKGNHIQNDELEKHAGFLYGLGNVS